MSKGKCYSMCNKGQRNKSDFYQTPYSMTEQLLEHEVFNYNKTVLEPASGEGAVEKILSKYFQCVFSSDKRNGFDFLETKQKMAIPYIITNPPFSLAFEFIQKAKEIAKEKFAMLLPLSYLHGQKRYNSEIFTNINYPLTKIYVFTRYPLLTDTIRDDGKYKTGMMVYGWFIWERNANILNRGTFARKEIDINTIPQIKWIDNNEYVLSRKDAF